MASPIVNISEGAVRGSFGTDLMGIQFLAFFAIPYGKPPVGDLRFKAPQPVESWDGVRDATKELGNGCLQMDLLSQPKSIIGSEDCLQLHVFTRTLPQKDSKPKPVIVWIPGGGFLIGSNSVEYAGPEFIMTEDVVMVYVSYRVGILGFLNLKNPALEVPGNAGLKDQVLALQWVQRNIKHFNGDPNDVTIFGQSAGSTSAQYLMLSPSAKGLYHKAIQMSGAVFNPWVGSSYSLPEFMSSLGQGTEDEEKALAILRKLPAEELIAHQDNYTSSKPSVLGVFGPVIEKPNPTAFLTKKPIDLMISGEYYKVPLLIGYTSNEGLTFMRTTDLHKVPGSDQPVYEPNLEDFIPPVMGIEKGSPTSQLISGKLKEFYFRDNMENTPEFNSYMVPSDYHFIMGIIASAIHFSKTSNHPVYLYEMTLVTQLNWAKKKFGLEAFPGVNHADDVAYLFKTEVYNENITQFEKDCIRRHVKLWTNFAKCGNPTPNGTDLNFQWDPMEEGDVNTLDIGKILKMRINPEAERVKLWKDIFQLSPATANWL